MHAVARWGSLAILVGLMAFCLWRGVASIEAKLQGNAVAALQRAGLPGSTLEFDGRDASLSGPAADRDRLQQAARLVADMDGVRGVRLTLARSAGKPRIPPAQSLGAPRPAEPQVVPAYRGLQQPVMVFSEGAELDVSVSQGRLRFAGTVPAQVAEALKDIDADSADVAVQHALYSPRWLAGLASASRALREGLIDGELRLTADGAFVSGTVDSEPARTTLVAALSRALQVDVQDALRIRPPETPLPEVAAAPAPPVPAPSASGANAASLLLEQRQDTVRVTGRLPDRTELARVVGAVQELWGTAYTDYAIEIASQVDVPTWLAGVLELLGAVKNNVQAPRLQISGDQVVLEGQVASEGVGQWLVAEARRLLPAQRIESRLGTEAIAAGGAHPLQVSLDRLLGDGGIEFELGSANLTTDARSTLDDLVHAIMASDSTMIYVHGHTDNLGEDSENMLLSQARAQAVVDYLSRQGVPAQRLQAQGFGASRPTASNETQAGRQANRRVEFHVMTETAR